MLKPPTIPPDCSCVRLSQKLGPVFKKGTIFKRGQLKIEEDKGRYLTVWFANPAIIDIHGNKMWLSDGFIRGEFTGLTPRIWHDKMFEPIDID